MTTRRRLASFLVLAWAAAALAAGQEFVVDAPAGDARNAVFLVDDSNFDQWVFGGQQNAQAARARFDSQLMALVDELDRVCGLTEAQKKKLLLAGHGDVKRFLDQVEEKRQEFQQVKTDQAKFGAFFQTLRPLQTTYTAGLFNPGSFFEKATRCTLTPEQLARSEEQAHAKAQARYKARVELVAASLGNTAGLTAEQRRKLAAVLLEETRPPRSFGSNDYQVVLLHAAKLPEDRLKLIFDDRQWQAIRPQLQNILPLEPSLKANGYVPPEGEGDGDKGAATALPVIVPAGIRMVVPAPKAAVRVEVLKQAEAPPATEPDKGATPR